MLERAHLQNELSEDEDADFLIESHRGTGALLVVSTQSRVLGDRWSMLVIPAGVDAVFARTEAALVTVQPGAARVEDDVAPALPRLRLEGHFAKHTARQFA